MKKTLNILLLILGIGGLILIGITIFIGTSMGKKADNYVYEKTIPPPLLGTEKRTLFVFYTEMAKPIMDYELVISENDSITKYAYNNLKDTEMNMRFSYHKRSKKLVFNFKEYLITSDIEFQNHKISKFNFRPYKLEAPTGHATGPILFNLNYGVLGIGNGEGPQFIFLPSSNLDLTKEVINELYN
ncbi:hypothetical protein [Winogradskyella rapida]|uniref:Uncharacterized protein n=1 Tax=Winogradskyella rapida TaxID=549701 RepID=A0ABW3KQ33_9FLAO